MIVSRTELVLGRIMLVVVLLLTLLPFASMITAALQSPDKIPSGFSIPLHPQWSNFATAFTQGNIGPLMLSSLFIVVVTVPVTLLLSTLAGYALGNLRIPGARIVLIAMVLGLTIPFEAIVIPLYYQMTSFGVINTQWAVILPLIGLYMPFSVFWMRAHFVGVPPELSEAARVDGASISQEFRQIQMPLATPALSALGILLFLWTWNQFLLPLVMISDPNKRTAAGALGAFQGQYIDALPLLFAASLLVMLPTVVIYVVFQRQFIKALLQGAVKG
ncbi:carbohydrate ABC transporter permease [Frondihabitans peucedani]|uniref:Carbohydrate ABC transporter permease n=1 Tax=Frondihabitans peucedani TaxID=598626 RepID=A0ABP8E5N5_9MICO